MRQAIGNLLRCTALIPEGNSLFWWKVDNDVSVGASLCGVLDCLIFSVSK